MLRHRNSPVEVRVRHCSPGGLRTGTRIILDPQGSDDPLISANLWGSRLFILVRTKDKGICGYLVETNEASPL